MIKVIAPDYYPWGFNQSETHLICRYSNGQYFAIQSDYYDKAIKNKMILEDHEEKNGRNTTYEIFPKSSVNLETA